MKDINKSRLTVWSLILLITLSATVVGILKYNQGYGRGLQAKEDLEKITNAFNSSQFIQSYKSSATIKAESKSNYITVKYSKGIHDTILVFDYKEQGPIQLIELQYSQEDKTAAEIVGRGMIEATATVNGSKDGEVFNNFAYDEFRHTSLSDGVTLMNTGENYSLKINIKTNVLENLKKQQDVVPDTNETGFEIAVDVNSHAEDYINYTLPEGFIDNTKQTATNKCYVTFDILSNFPNAERYATDLSAYAAAESSTVDGTDFRYYKISETKTVEGNGRTHHIVFDIQDKIILIRMTADVDNDECNEELETILSTISLKQKAS